jgi:nucleoside-diphosphate-sugar epimerase
MKKKVLLIGGLGFIGYHVIRELESRNYDVTVGSRSTTSSEHVTAQIVSIDLANLPIEKIKSIVSEFDTIIFAGGVDDRTFPTEPARDFFYKGNVIPCVKLAEACQNTNVNKIIILGSYFTHFNREKPEWKMAERHPYVRSRKLQSEETIEAAGPDTVVVTLDLPYIFGATPGKVPLWKPLVKYIKSMRWLFYTKGGTNIISVEQVAQATVGAIENVHQNESIAVGGQNVSWKEMIGMFAKALNKKRGVLSVPTFIVKGGTYITALIFKLRGKQSGLNLFHFITTQTSHTYLDCEASMKKLNYPTADLQQSINETVEACGFKK